MEHNIVLAVIIASMFGPLVWGVGIAIPGALGLGMAGLATRFLTMEQG